MTDFKLNFFLNKNHGEESFHEIKTIVEQNY